MTEIPFKLEWIRPNPDTVDKDSWTPLSLVGSSGRESVMTLLGHSASVSAWRFECAKHHSGRLLENGRRSHRIGLGIIILLLSFLGFPLALILI